MEVSVDVEVPGAHVLLHDELVLLHVAPGDHQVVLRADEPEELLEPEDLPRLVDVGDGCHLLQRLGEGAIE